MSESKPRSHPRNLQPEDPKKNDSYRNTECRQKIPAGEQPEPAVESGRLRYVDQTTHRYGSALIE